MRNTDRLDNLPTRAPMRPRRTSWRRVEVRQDRAARKAEVTNHG